MIRLPLKIRSSLIRLSQFELQQKLTFVTVSDVLNSSVNFGEVEKFSKIGDNWWDNGSSHGTGPLHAMNPVRVNFIRNTLAEQLSRSHLSPEIQLSGSNILDVGCGGGILSEALSRLEANVTSIDPSSENITIAKSHSECDPQTSKICYLQKTVEEMAMSDVKFDAVCALEVIEHVENPLSFLAACSKCLKPGGSLYISTINRTPKALVMAKLLPEYFLRLLPIGTHEWNKFITLEEMTLMLEASYTGQLHVKKKQGMIPSVDINPWAVNNFRWKMSDTDFDVHYILQAVKP